MLFLLIAAAAVAAVALGSKTEATSRTIPGPAGADVRRLPAGSIVMTRGLSEAVVIVSQGAAGYTGRSVVSGIVTTFTPDEITLVQFVAPGIPGLALPGF